MLPLRGSEEINKLVMSMFFCSQKSLGVIPKLNEISCTHFLTAEQELAYIAQLLKFTPGMYKQWLQ